MYTSEGASLKTLDEDPQGHLPLPSTVVFVDPSRVDNGGPGRGCYVGHSRRLRVAERLWLTAHLARTQNGRQLQ